MNRTDPLLESPIAMMANIITNVRIILKEDEEAIEAFMTEPRAALKDQSLRSLIIAGKVKYTYIFVKEFMEEIKECQNLNIRLLVKAKSVEKLKVDPSIREARLKQEKEQINELVRNHLNHRDMELQKFLTISEPRAGSLL